MAYKYTHKKTGKKVEFDKPIDPKLRQEYRLTSFISNTKMKSDEVVTKTDEITKKDSE